MLDIHPNRSSTRGVFGHPEARLRKELLLQGKGYARPAPLSPGRRGLLVRGNNKNSYGLAILSNDSQ